MGSCIAGVMVQRSDFKNSDSSFALFILSYFGLMMDAINDPDDFSIAPIEAHFLFLTISDLIPFHQPDPQIIFLLLLLSYEHF
ncbi:MAG: hypothetical protein K0R08_235 [Solimicrobium sp.]|jgi:hypothetical protein|nr:hypothetical protein [Solimicrobium sp.]